MNPRQPSRLARVLSTVGRAPNTVGRMLDAAIAVLSPRWASNRTADRIGRDAMLATASFDAARSDRTRRTFPRVGSADDDLLADLDTMRSNARTLERDDSTAAAIIRVLVENCIGEGLVAQSKVQPGSETGFSKAEADAWNEAVEKLVRRHMNRGLDATEHSDGSALQRQWFRELVRDGELLLHRAAKPLVGGRTLSIAYQSIDPDRLMNPRAASDPRLRGGIRVDEWGAPTEYWITPFHPTENPRKVNQPVMHPAVAGDLPNILHVFERTRSGQRRGVPLFSPSYGLMEAVNDVIQSETVATRAAAKIAMVVTQTPVPNLLQNLPNAQPRDDGAWTEKLEAGVIKRLKPGEDVKPFVPSRPSQNWDAYMVRMLRLICAPFGLPYEMVLRDFKDMNYSVSRTAMMEAHRGFAVWQDLIGWAALEPVRTAIIYDAVVSGLLPMPKNWLTNRAAYLDAIWVPPSWGYQDPAVEIKASADAIANNLSTPQIEAARNGQDVEQVLRERAKAIVLARAIAAENGLPEDALLPPPTGTAPQPSSAAPAPADNAPQSTPNTP